MCSSSAGTSLAAAVRQLSGDIVVGGGRAPHRRCGRADEGRLGGSRVRAGKARVEHHRGREVVGKKPGFLPVADERDLPFIRHTILLTLIVVPVSAYFYLSGHFSWWIAFAYWVVVFAVLLYLRYGYHLRGRHLAVLTIVAFALLVVTLASSHTLVQGGAP